MRKGNSGMSVILIALFTLLLLAILVTTVALSGYRTRNEISRDYQGYQAFLAADSGIKTFSQRLLETKFRGSLYQAPCWVQGANVSGMDAGLPACTRTAKLPQLILDDSADKPRVDVKIVGEGKNDRDKNGSIAPSAVVEATGYFGSTTGTPSKSTVVQHVFIVSD